MQQDRIEEILTFWFGNSREDPAAVMPRNAFWFGGDEEVDGDIRACFANDVEQASAGELDNRAAEPYGRLALILLLDQFRRSLYRGTGEAFACDRRALGLTLEGLEQRADEPLAPVERLFFLMPLQHSESAEMQALSVLEFSALAASADEQWREPFLNSLRFAREHRDIIERFGRFPHRNRALGRSNTPEETAWLTSGAATYGQ
ncbi:DUF924 family protein [soil metagenome]